MAKNLVVVESPAKARTIARYLGKDYEVRASKGHVKDLPERELGVDVAADFAPNYVTLRGKGAVLKELRKLGRAAETVYLAPDPDREGEAIAFHIAEEITRGKTKQKNGPVLKRVMIEEITQRGVKEAFANPKDLNIDRYNSQQARRILDRLVGYQISPILWDKVRRGLSAGRVQSVAVRLIVDREREIEAFEAIEYWKLQAHLEGDTKPSFWAQLIRLDGKQLEVNSGEEAKRHADALAAETYQVAKAEKKERKRHPRAPFITSTLQQEAVRKLRLPAKRTMMTAQRLYEGVELGERGRVGLITYMRTDSTRVSNDAIAEVRTFIGETYGKQHVSAKPRIFKKKKRAQDAHEAIRPSSVRHTPDSVAKFLKKDELRLYTMIWRRFVASQMASAIYDATTIDVTAGPYTLRVSGSVLRFSGYQAVYLEGKDEDADPEKDADRLLPLLNAGDLLKKLELTSAQCFTKPPPRFTEATLVKELEEDGIGRPSTYAAIIGTIQAKKYVEIDRGRFAPTELGSVVTELLVENFPAVLNVEFTAGMEDELDKIEAGTSNWVDVLNKFYGPFSKTLDKAKVEMRNLKREATPTGFACDQCGAEMMIRWGKNGSFLACSAYPECRNTREYKREDGKVVLIDPEIIISGTCDDCGADMIIKVGRYGRFRACSRYPDCKFTAPVSTGVTCPDCGEVEIVEKRTRRGKTFYGCSRYPKCQFASWDEPIGTRCPHCENPYIVRKVRRDGTQQVSCPICKEAVELEAPAA
jgi:DNA topoisomerase-1